MLLFKITNVCLYLGLFPLSFGLSVVSAAKIKPRCFFPLLLLMNLHFQTQIPVQQEAFAASFIKTK